MLRRIVFCLMMAVAGMIVAGSADARPRRIDATPFSHAPCSVLSRHPCTPSFCSVFHRGPCIPEIDYPYGENLQLTVETVPPQDDAAKYQKPDHDLDTIGDLFAALPGIDLEGLVDDVAELEIAGRLGDRDAIQALERVLERALRVRPKLRVAEAGWQ